MNLNERIESQKERLGIWEYSVISTKEIPFSDEVRRICEKNACGMYGTNWACPPAVGSVQACREKCMQWDNALVVTTKTVLESRYDVSLWKSAAKAHESVTDDVLALVRGVYPDAYALSTEGCGICASCTYPDALCRFPERMHPAVESFGISVVELSKKSGVRYINGADSITYFSVILF